MMRKLALLLVCVVCFSSIYGQTISSRNGRVDVEVTIEKRPKRIYVKAEFASSSGYRDSILTESIEKQLRQSLLIAKRVKKGKYLASVQFLLTKDSSLAEVRCIIDPGFGIGQEVLRIVKKHTTWRPSAGIYLKS